MKIVNPCPDGQVLDKATKECRPPLKRGRKTCSNNKANATAKSKAKAACPDGKVLDKVTKECRPPLKRGRTAKKSPKKSPNKSPIKVQDNTTLDKYGFVVPVYKPKVYNDEKKYRQTTIAFSKHKLAQMK